MKSITEKLKKEILERDNNKCVICDGVSDLEVHHKDIDGTNNVKENLITLCRDHHKGFHVENTHGNVTEIELLSSNRNKLYRFSFILDEETLKEIRKQSHGRYICKAQYIKSLFIIKK